MTYYYLLAAAVFVTVVQAQSQAIPSSINTSEGLVYLIAIILFALNIVTPIARCLYVRYVKDWVTYYMRLQI
jgi:hypothetical protein